jgi:hypothetical protein
MPGEKIYLGHCDEPANAGMEGSQVARWPLATADRPVGSDRLDAAEEGRGGGEDGVVVVGKCEKVPALKVRATVTEIFGDESAGVMSADNDDGPFTAQRVLGGKICASDTSSRVCLHAGTEGDDQGAAFSQVAVTSGGGGGEPARALEPGEHKRWGLQTEALLFDVA